MGLEVQGNDVQNDAEQNHVGLCRRDCEHIKHRTTTMDDVTYVFCKKLKDWKRTDIDKCQYMETESGIKDSGDRTQFASGAVRDMHSGKGRMDLLPWNAIIEVSKHCENGAQKYGEHNVDKGIPLHSLIDSGLRHAAKFVSGQTDEPHLTASVWNLLWALEMQLTRPDLVDIPWCDSESDREA